MVKVLKGFKEVQEFKNSWFSVFDGDKVEVFLSVWGERDEY